MKTFRVKGSELPKATHMGELPIVNLSIPCAVLDDGKRVLSDRGMRLAFGFSGRPTSKQSNDGGCLDLPCFLATSNLKPFISKDFTVAPIAYRPSGGGPAVQGFEASVLPDVCLVYLAARRAGKLHKSQEHIAEACEIILGALARTGITALIDEATGYQADRGRDALQRLFNRYLRESFAAWSMTFYPDFYQRLFALRGWKWASSKNSNYEL